MQQNWNKSNINLNENDDGDEWCNTYPWLFEIEFILNISIGLQKGKWSMRRYI